MTSPAIVRKGLGWPAARMPKQRAMVPPPEPERILQRKVVRLAELLGWKIHTTWSSIHSPSGWPDVFLAKVGRNGVGRCITFELKSEKGRTTPAQEEWLAVLQACGIRAYVFRPSQWNEIVAVLQEAV